MSQFNTLKDLLSVSKNVTESFDDVPANAYGISINEAANAQQLEQLKNSEEFKTIEKNSAYSNLAKNLELMWGYDELYDYIQKILDKKQVGREHYASLPGEIVEALGQLWKLSLDLFNDKQPGKHKIKSDVWGPEYERGFFKGMNESEIAAFKTLLAETYYEDDNVPEDDPEDYDKVRSIDAHHHEQEHEKTEADEHEFVKFARHSSTPDFITAFNEKYGTSIDDWMDHAELHELKSAVSRNKMPFVVKGDPDTHAFKFKVSHAQDTNKWELIGFNDGIDQSEYVFVRH